MNAKANLAQNNGIDRQLRLVLLKPLYHLCDRSRLGGLAENIGINKVSHRASVDSESTGTKKSLTGQVSNQVTRPSFARESRRTSRYSPRAMRSTSNSWPGLM